MSRDTRANGRRTRAFPGAGHVNLVPRFVDLLRLGGLPAWQVAAGLDVVRTAGWEYVRQHRKDNIELAALGDGPRDAVYRRIWGDAAAEFGADTRELAPGYLELRKGATRTRVHHQTVMLDDALTVQLALEKTLVDRLLIEAGLPVPEHVEFDLARFDLALAFLESGPSPCVVKPTSGAGGASVTAGITTGSELLRATVKASRFFPRLIIERQALGSAYRLLFLDGRLLDVVRRLPPRVIGDGRSTIAELIAAENQRRRAGYGSAGLVPLRIDLDCVFTLAGSNLTLRSIPAPGVVIAVKTVTNQNCVRDNETVGEPLSPNLVAAAALAVQVVGLRLGGVDLITTDPYLPLTENGGVILEVNSSPGLHHHYLVAEPSAATPVAVEVLRTLFTQDNRIQPWARRGAQQER